MAAALLSKRLLPRLKQRRSLCQITQRSDRPVDQDDTYVQSSEMIHFSGRPDRRTSPYVYFVKRSDAADNVMFLRMITTTHLYSDHYNYVINLVCLRPPFSQPAAARPILAQIVLRGHLFSLSTFSHLIQAYCKDQQLSHLHALDLFKGMNQLLFTFDTYFHKHSFYKYVMAAMFARFGFFSGYQLLKNLTSQLSIVLPLWCYDVIVARFCRRKTVADGALVDVLMEMKNHNVIPDENIYKYLLKMRTYGRDDLLKAASIGKQMFTEGIKIGALSPVLCLD